MKTYQENFVLIELVNLGLIYMTKIFCFRCKNEIPELKDIADPYVILNFCNDCYKVMK